MEGQTFEGFLVDKLLAGERQIFKSELTPGNWLRYRNCPWTARQFVRLCGGNEVPCCRCESPVRVVGPKGKQEGQTKTIDGDVYMLCDKCHDELRDVVRACTAEWLVDSEPTASVERTTHATVES